MQKGRYRKQLNLDIVFKKNEGQIIWNKVESMKLI